MVVHPDLFGEVVKLERECNSSGYYLMSKNVPFDEFAGVKAVKNLKKFGSDVLLPPLLSSFGFMLVMVWLA